MNICLMISNVFIFFVKIFISFIDLIGIGDIEPWNNADFLVIFNILDIF